MISIEGASKVFETRGGAVTALSEVSLTIARNEFICLVGPSGCGKSTLLRLIGGLMTPSAGTIAIDGTKVVEPRFDTGIVFQAPTLLPWASILDNVLFPLKMMGKLKPQSKDRARELLKLVALEGMENRYPRELSGGQQQRVGIARSLIHDPDILLMDEPFAALDALTREELTMETLRIWGETPKTVVFVTHSIPEAVILADRVVVMAAKPGRIAEIIPVDLPRPRDFDMGGRPEFQDCAHRIREHIFGGRKVRAA